MDTSFEAVYYPFLTPTTPEALTLLGLVFDRVHFPGVFIPTSGYDPQSILRALDRREPSPSGLSDDEGSACLWAAAHMRWLSEFCHFTGEDRAGANLGDERVAKLQIQMDKLLFGPSPTHTLHAVGGFTVPVPESSQCVRGPQGLSYPANALLYSVEKELPLVNDDPRLPVPATRTLSPDLVTKLHASVLAIEAVKMALPDLPALDPERVVELRQHTSAFTTPFRLGMIRLTSRLNDAARSGLSEEEMVAEAAAIVRAEVFPLLDELKAMTQRPTWPLTKWASEAFGFVAATAAKFCELPPWVAASGALDHLLQIWQRFKEEKEAPTRNPCHYLLEVQRRAQEWISPHAAPHLSPQPIRRGPRLLPIDPQSLDPMKRVKLLGLRGLHQPPDDA